MSREILYIIARVLIASLFIVIGGERLLIGFGILPSVTSFSTVVLIISAFEVLAGLLIAIGWQLRWLADAVGSHPFWAAGAEAMHNQLLHFAKNMAIVGGCLLLVALDPKQTLH